MMYKEMQVISKLSKYQTQFQLLILLTNTTQIILVSISQVSPSLFILHSKILNKNQDNTYSVTEIIQLIYELFLGLIGLISYI